MNRPGSRLPISLRPPLGAVGRFIQFRSELAILAVLAMGVATGAAARRALSVPGGPSAVIAAPPSSPASRPAAATRPSAPARADLSSPQVPDSQ